MATFLVEDMTCAHCEATLRKAIRAVAPAARVDVDLSRHLLHVETTGGNDKLLVEAIRAAGYTPVDAGGAS